ncbi:hypothetical protein AVEN_271311-1 [Araneus ventricosus]|uniref:Uncharacterized protein n=1 Tax=Araneus ventricosus TaxID=182803 RepID=A0A4Y2P3U3_ARAVE|nr:hypothetical protein AVEN_271311-1 [Araneus ventricosus]
MDGILKLEIHESFIPRKWSGGTPHDSIFQPIHFGRSFTEPPREPQAHHLRALQSPTFVFFDCSIQNANPCLLGFPLERESVYTLVVCQYLLPALLTALETFQKHTYKKEKIKLDGTKQAYANLNMGL